MAENQALRPFLVEIKARMGKIARLLPKLTACHAQAAGLNFVSIAAMKNRNSIKKAVSTLKKAVLLWFVTGSAAQAQSLCWEITGNGLSQPSWLYGTIHVGDKRAFDFKPGVMDRFKQADAFAMELNPDSVDAKAMMSFVMAEEGKTLRDYFPKAEDYATVETYFRDKLHINLEQFKTYKPIFLYSMVMQTKFSNEMGQALDLWLFNQAGEQGKDRFGLETAEEQMGAFESMGEEAMVTMLLELLDKKKTSDKDMKLMMKYYVKGDLDKLLEIMDESESGAAMEEKLLNNRNHVMAERMEPLMKEGSTFVAVGAAHLPGEEGVIELLRKKGYTVVPVKK